MEASANDPEVKPSAPIIPTLTDVNVIRKLMAKRLKSKQMNDYSTVNILDMIDAIGEDTLSAILSDFY